MAATRGINRTALFNLLSLPLSILILLIAGLLFG